MSPADSSIAAQDPRSIVVRTAWTGMFEAAWDSVEKEMTRALDAIRECARIAWWDGSSVGLRLNRFGGLLGLDEGEAVTAQGKRVCGDRA